MYAYIQYMICIYIYKYTLFYSYLFYLLYLYHNIYIYSTHVSNHQVQDLSVPGATPPQSGPGSPEQKQVGSLGISGLQFDVSGGFLRSFLPPFGLLMSQYIYMYMYTVYMYMHTVYIYIKI